MAAATGVWMPPIKELNYFRGNTFKAGNLAAVARNSAASWRRDAKSDSDSRFFETFERGHVSGVDLNWYLELFEPKGSHISGDISPNYAKMDPSQIEVTVRSCPDSKYILLLRDPVSRFWSGASMGVRRGRIAEQDLMQWRTVSDILARGAFQEQSFPTRVWKKWSAMLSPASLRFWFLDDIATIPEATRQEIARFVGLPGMQSSLSPSFNRKSDKQRFVMPVEVRLGLAKHFSEEIREAADLFGGHAVTWLQENQAVLGSAR
jgi:hypothetical protein